MFKNILIFVNKYMFPIFLTLVALFPIFLALIVFPLIILPHIADDRPEPELVKESYTIEQNIRNGVFINSESARVSWYVTRVKEDPEGVPSIICIVQRQEPDGVFENCVYKNTLFGWIKSHDGYITREAKYSYY